MMDTHIVIGGPPKCGTSSLFNWLAAHPKIRRSQPKELFYFMDEDSPLINKSSNVYTNGFDGYQDFFPKGSSIKLEGTTHYLYQKSAPKFISELQGTKKILFVLRDPAERAYSSFNYTKNNLAALPSNASFLEYAQLIMKNQTAQWIDESPSAYVLRNDIEYGKYGQYLNYWYQYFKKDEILILLFDDIVRNTKGSMSRICDFLNIDSSFYHGYEFGKRNETISIRNKAVHKSLLMLKKSFPFLKPRGLKRLYFKFQTKKRDTSEDDLRALELLRDYYSPYNEQLSRLIEMDLSDWKARGK